MSLRFVVVVLALAGGCRGSFDPLVRDGAPGETDGAVGIDASMTIDGPVMSVDAPPDSSTSCVNTLSNVGQADFEIAFTIQTTASGPAELMWQRATCNNPPYWDVSLGSGTQSGRVLFTIRDASITASSPTSPIVNDGVPHAIVARRIAGNFQVLVDGGNPNGQSTPANLGALPALAIQGTHPCGTTVAAATLTNVCVRPL